MRPEVNFGLNYPHVIARVIITETGRHRPITVSGASNGGMTMVRELDFYQTGPASTPGRFARGLT